MMKNLLVYFLFILFSSVSFETQAQSPTAPANAFKMFVQNGATFYSSETQYPQSKTVLFATKTNGSVDDNTKVLCNRLKGSELLGIENVTINNVPLVAYTLRTAEGDIEHAMRFVIGKASGRNYYSIQSNWLNQDYTPEETMYNIELCAASIDSVTDVAANIISTLGISLPIQYLRDHILLPDNYIFSGTRNGANFNLVIANKSLVESNGYLLLQDQANEQSAATTKRTIPVTIQANGQTNISIPMNDRYASTIYLYVNDKLKDVGYTADGIWSYDASTASSVSSFKVLNDAVGKNYPADELPVFRNVQINAVTSDNVSVSKLLRAGGLPQDLSSFKTMKFTASGGNHLRITFIKKSIANNKDQYSITIPLSADSKDYFLSLSNLVSTATANSINANDITTIVFSIETTTGQTTSINSTLSNISFAKQTVEYLQSLSEKELQLAPNPAKSKFVCSFMSDKDRVLTLRVLDLATGRILCSKEINAVTGINNVAVDINKTTGGNTMNVVALEGTDVQYKRTKILIDNK